VFGRRGRVERRLRERGRPAWARVTGVDDLGDGRWRLHLTVEPGDGEPFEARAEIEDTGPEGPEPGGIVEVLHDPDRRGRVRVMGTPSRPPPPEPPPAPDLPGPDLGAVVRGLARALGDGSLAQGLPVVVTDDAPPPPAAPRTGPDLSHLPLDRLAARAGHDPSSVLAEVTRRVGAGEATLPEVLAAARQAGLSGADLARIMRAQRPPPS